MSLPQFPLPYLFDVEETSTYATTTIVFSSQKKQVQRHGVNPLETWKIDLKGTPAQKTTLKDFWDSIGGNAGKFLFVDPDGNTRTCRFSDNKLTIVDKREFNASSDTHGTIVGFTCETTVEVVL